MKKITILIALLSSMFFFAGCSKDMAEPSLVAKGDNGPYPTNYKEIAKRAWTKVRDSNGNVPFYPDSITTTKPYKAYSRKNNSRIPDEFGYFVRTCAKFKKKDHYDREVRCYRLIIRKNSYGNEGPGYFQVLRFEPFYAEPWFESKENDHKFKS